MNRSIGTSALTGAPQGVFLVDPSALPKPEPGDQGIIIRDRFGELMAVCFVPAKRWAADQAGVLQDAWAHFDERSEPTEAAVSPRPQIGLVK